MKNLRKSFLVAGCVCLSFTLFSFKSTNQTLKQAGDLAVVYESKTNLDSNQLAFPTLNLLKKLFQKDCKLLLYTVVDALTSVVDSKVALENNLAKEKESKLSNL
jgi:hypothetical protein